MIYNVTQVFAINLYYSVHFIIIAIAALGHEQSQ